MDPESEGLQILYVSRSETLVFHDLQCPSSWLLSLYLGVMLSCDLVPLNSWISAVLMVLSPRTLNINRLVFQLYHNIPLNVHKSLSHSAIM